MYITELIVQYLKLLQDVTIPFTRGGQPRMWTVLVGENGLCKTTILQAIALAASGPDRANQLAEIAALPDRRKSENAILIRAAFDFGPVRHCEREYPQRKSEGESPPHLLSWVAILPGWKVFLGSSEYREGAREMLKDWKELVLWGNDPLQKARQVQRESQRPLEEARGRGLPFWFVAGYGVNRTLPFPKNSERPSDPVRERLASLFDKGRIIATGFADLITDPEFKQSYIQTLRDALRGHEGILPRIQQLELESQGGIKTAKDLIEAHVFGFQAGKQAVNVPATWLSHGYQATIAWIADLIGQMFWETGKPVALNKMEGLVLIDELDLHLHPRWQAGLVRALKATFPHVQFVATTHSPMVLPGLEADEIFHVDLDEEGNVQVKPSDQSPKLMTGSEIYGAFFDIHKLYPEAVGEALSRYGYIASNPGRSEEEEEELTKILALLKEERVEPGWEPTPRNGKEGGSKKSPPRRKRR